MMIRRFFLLLAALWLAVAPAAADFGALFLAGSMGGEVHEPASLARATCVADDSNATTYSGGALASISTGLTATDTAVIVVAILSEDSATAFGVNSALANSIAMTELTDQGGAQLVNAAIYATPTAISGVGTVSVSVTHSEAVTSAIVCVWALKNLRSATPTAATNANSSNSSAMALTLNPTSIGGFAVGICGTTSINSSATWAVLTEREDTQSGETDYSNADAATTGSSMSVTCDWTNTNASVGAAAAFR